MKASTTAGPALPMTSPETFEQGIIEVVTRLVTQNFTEHFTQPFRAGVLTTTSADMTETTSDTFLGVLTTTSADMTETTSDTFLVGAANVDDGSFEAIIFGGGIFVLLLALLLALLVLRYIVKHKGTYHTNEAECGDSVDKYGSDSQSEQVQLEILDKEE
ncbi:cell adhesion molecule 1 isoform X2 [Salmo trutta]|uniref:cell adhesion molecule 1 isoform X2 n=1 Tax=Salmo trutta TaxID=8032 RepID=UPI001130F4BD|nr:cell adhesion molecule 1-like isoform X2 [Salmo trutta]